MKTWIIGALAIGTSLYACPAHAGYWKFNGFEYEQKALSDFQHWRSPSPGNDGFYQDLNPYNQAAFLAEQYFAESQDYIYAFGSDGSISFAQESGAKPAPWSYGGGVSYGSVNMTPVFEWVPGNLTGQTGPDPNDKPPAKFWYWEYGSARIDIVRHDPENAPYAPTEANPYNGSPFSVVEISNGIGSSVTRQQPTPSQIVYESKGGGLVVKDTGGNTIVRGEQRKLVARVAASSWTAEERHTREAHMSVWYQIDLVDFDLMSRIKANHNPSDLYTNLSPGSRANIAVGGLAGDKNIHQADVILRVLRRGSYLGKPAISDIPSSRLPRLWTRNARGNKRRVSTSNLGGTTNADGRILRGRITSRDLVDTTKTPDVVMVEVPNSSHPIPMRWADSIEWKMGENGEKAWAPANFGTSTDYSEWVWTKTLFDPGTGNVGLEPHRVRYVIDFIETLEWEQPETPEGQEPVPGSWKKKIRTTVPSKAQGYSSPEYDVSVYRDTNLLRGNISQFVTLPAPETLGEDGIYKGKVTINRHKEWVVKGFDLALEDQGVYRPKPTPTPTPNP